MPATNYCRLITLLEPEIQTQLEELAARTGYNRTKIIRMMVKYCLRPENVIAALGNGDPPPVPSKPTRTTKAKKK